MLRTKILKAGQVNHRSMDMCYFVQFQLNKEIKTLTFQPKKQKNYYCIFHSDIALQDGQFY